jgi:hypothetical protein
MANPDPNSADESRDLEALAKKRVDAKLGFLTHLLVFCCVNLGFYVLGSLGDWHWNFAMRRSRSGAGVWAWSSTASSPGPRCRVRTCAAA